MFKKTFLNPEKILDQIDLRDDMVAAEFGCGAGGFAIPLANRLEDGRVFAFDIQEEPLSALKSRAEIQHAANINIVRCNLEQPGATGLQDNFLDLVFLPNMLFQVKNKEAVVMEAKRVLRAGGEIVIIDWRKQSSFGPKEGRVSGEELKKIAGKIGLKLKEEFQAGKDHYCLIFEKN